MLDQKPDMPPEPETPRTDETPSDPISGGDGASGGGVLGRWRAGMTAKGDPFDHEKPLWRVITVGFLKWTSIIVGSFLILSVLAVFTIGWTGPPPTFNMAGVAMKGVEVRQKWVDLKDISPHLVRAVIAAEDQNFCAHQGFDMKEIQKAMQDAENGGDLRGASTISQQTAKNAYLWTGGGWPRKGAEAVFTLMIETVWPKARIMEVYLNAAEWGDGLFGAEAAAQARFGKSAADLTAREAALMAAVLPSPNRYRLDPPGDYVAGRASTLEARMRDVDRDGLARCVLG